MEVVIAPDTRLKVQTKSVKKINSALLQTLKEMVKLTKTFQDPEGVGLASTQIGLDEAFFVARLHDTKKTPPSNPGQRKNHAIPNFRHTADHTPPYAHALLGQPIPSYRVLILR